ncbi:conserved hypothetical protein [Sphingomonas sp. T1]|uniref:hypothetical protein n=1 Tax=Sphingomonas sp. T1 TaxID=2653172 RepID=UPI0012EF6D19|nr:hypothetical protein [Sphingomonas sp. T1]VXD05321.1 conserved hypothetical protein [Sphingomonas sp. T1]
MTDPTMEEVALYNDVTALGKDLWDISKEIEGLTNDPKMLSIMLFRRLWSNHQGYTLLWKSEMNLEASIVLRSAVEAAICIAANKSLGAEFVILMLQDTASTIEGQISVQDSHFGGKSVKEAKEVLQIIKAKMPANTVSKRLNWPNLAKKGGVDILYGFHRMLSAGSSHVTGISILRGVTSVGLKTDMIAVEALERRIHFMQLAWTTLLGVQLHAEMIGADAVAQRAREAGARMAIASSSWATVC